MPEVPNNEEIEEINDPKTRLLHAGARVLIDDGFEVLARGLTAEKVTDRAARTRRVFYDHFDSKEEFTREMLLEFLRIDDPAVWDGAFEEGFKELVIGAEGDVVESVHAICDAFYKLSTLSDEPQIHVIAWALAGDNPEILGALRAFQSTIDATYEHLIGEAMEQWNQTMRTPWTLSSLTIVIRSMIEGLYARNRITPGSVDLEFFEQCVLTTITGILQPADDPPERFDEALKSISRRTTVEWHERYDPQLMSNTRQTVLDAVAPALEATGLGTLSFDELGEFAEVSPGLIRQAFPTVEHVVCAATTANLPPLAREAAFDIQTAGLATEEVLLRHLTRVGRWGQSNPALAGAVIAGPMVASWATAESPTVTLLRSVAEPAIAILKQAQSAGEIHASTDVVPTATLLTHAVLSSAATRPQEDMAMSVNWLVDLVLYGASTGGRSAADRVVMG